MDDKELIDKILQSNPIAYRADFARITDSITAGVMLSQSMFWRGKSSKHNDGAFEKKSSEWESETAMTEKQQRTARHILETKGFLTINRGGAHGAMVYKVNTGAIYSALKAHYSECPNGSSDDQSAQMAEPELPKGQSRTDKRPFSPYIDYTENTQIENAEAFMPNIYKESKPKKTIKIEPSDKELAQAIYERLDNSSFKVEHSKTLTQKIVRAIKKHGLEKVKRATGARCAFQAAQGKDLYFHSFIVDDEAIEWHGREIALADVKSTLPVFGAGEKWYAES